MTKKQAHSEDCTRADACPPAASAGRDAGAAALPTPYTQCVLKLDLRPSQERMLRRWLWNLTGVYNWAIRKIDQDSKYGQYHTQYGLEGLLAGHSKRLGIPALVLEGTARTAYQAWDRCFRGYANRPKMKGRRNRLNSVPFRRAEGVRVEGRRLVLHGLGRVKFHKQAVPDLPVTSARLIQRPSGWYACLVMKGGRLAIERTGNGEIGIDPGFSALLTTSDGQVLEHPRELEEAASRLASAQRSGGRSRARALQERIARQRKDRNHKLSLQLVRENRLIAFSADPHKRIAARFGKSVTSSGHYQLRQFLAYKSRAGGSQYIEVSSRNSTIRCSSCGALTGPAGLSRLPVRQWTCSACGASHDRDVNAAVNTLIAGRGIRLESVREGVSGIATKATRRRSFAARPGKRTKPHTAPLQPGAASADQERR